MVANSLIEQLDAVVKVDADTYDYDFIATLPIKPEDATSNQGFIHQALVDPRNRAIVEGVAKDLGKDAAWEDLYVLSVARIAKKVLPLLRGRVLAQTSTAHAYDEAKVVEWARRYAKAFNAEGITNDRFCIKIPVTSAGIAAAKTLYAEGIPTLGTALFSVHQAIAAAQANMLSISMYLNAFEAHAAAASWPDVADPAIDAPMAHRHIQIRKIYDDMKAAGKTPPLMKTASFISVAEALAMAEQGADHVTVGVPILTDLATYDKVPEYKAGQWQVPFKTYGADTKWSVWTPGKPSDARMQALLDSDPLTPNFKPVDPSIDYTAPGVVDKLNDEDAVTRDRISVALKAFTANEMESKQFLQGLQAALA